MSRPSTPRARPSFAALVQSFFTEYLTQQRALSPQTVAAYRDAFVLFLDFATAHLHRQPTTMRLQDITPELILAFLDHLERDRGNAVRTRNALLAALRAFLKFAGHRDVDALHVVEQALGVPMKRFERPMLGFLSREEMLAIIGKPGPNWTSQRDTCCCTCSTTPARGCPRSSAFAWPMSCSTARPACTCMARAASNGRCRCGDQRSRRCGHGCG